ncbi:nuclear transport factor 2 family protein [Pseudomonas putida]|uniref:nuclear transport factor 2 family protein n=1 Tax=Pseudomonas putida TaxID=303 RepID=UPI001CE4AD24|nr:MULTISPECIES: nuclear transport factor 2 family protein [Pseudomonas]MDZ5111359.1 nuclear transport factor 2 family protein [Pseudomonas putida]
MKRDKFAALLVTTALALGAVAGAYASDSANPQPGHIVDRASFEHYLELFNQKDPAAFEQYYAANVRMSNGGLVFNGIPEVEAHYRNIWGAMEEQVIVEDFLFDGKTLAVQLHTIFLVPRDAAQTPFGPIRQGERFDYHGPVFYKLNEAGQFTEINVGYYRFTRTTDGVTRSMGMPH